MFFVYTTNNNAIFTIYKMYHQQYNQPPPPPCSVQVGIPVQQYEQPFEKTMSELQDESDATLVQLQRDYEICDEFARRIKNVRGVPVVFIVDDSGSTMNDYSGVQRGDPINPWDEEQRFVSIALRAVRCVDRNGSDIYFLNRPGPVKDVLEPSQLIPHFKQNPSGYTPLADTYRRVLNANDADIAEKGLHIVIMTDGRPTDDRGREDIADFKRALTVDKHRYEKPHHEKGKHKGYVRTTILACTQDQSVMRYLDGWDKEIKNLEVLDDYQSEKKKVRKINPKQQYSTGDHIVRVLVAAFDPWFDNINERKVSAKPPPLPQDDGGCCVIC